MTRAKHLTDDALLLLAGQRLSTEDRRKVVQHLEGCESCRERHGRLEFANSVFERLAEVGLNEVMGSVPEARAARPSREFSFPWGPVSAIVFGCVCVLVVLFYPRAIPQASASELLADAMRSESQSGAPTAFRLEVEGTPCAAGERDEQLVSFERSVNCNRALELVKETDWGHGNPLSARTYSAWHDSLQERHDSVAKRNASWEIQTTTADGLVRAASLEMRASDYHTTELRLRFGNNEEVSISEDKETLPVLPVANVRRSSVLPEVKYADKPGDVLEAQAWELLHDLKADTGWEGLVVRDGSEVIVKAVVDPYNEQQKRELVKGFERYPAIKLDMLVVTRAADLDKVMPARTLLHLEGAPLAEPWLEREFPDGDALDSYVNGEERASRAILGRTFLIDKLKQRQAVLVHCSCAKALSDLVAKEEIILISQQMSLSDTLKPLIGSPLRSPSRPLAFQEAQNLDMALQKLLKAPANPDSPSLEDRVDEVRSLL